MTDNNIITGLLKTQGKERVYQMADGSIQSYQDGSASWRHNNPGNLKFEYANSADSTVHTQRTKEKALSDAQHRYKGIVALDQWGNAVFETYEAGRAAKIQLLEQQHGERTVPEMLKKYSKPDYTGATHWDAQEASIYKTADAQGINLRGKKIGDMSDLELAALADGIKNFEGWKKGSIEVIKPSKEQTSPDLHYKSSPDKDTPPQSANTTVDTQSSLSKTHQTLITDSEKHVHNLYKEYGLTVDKGTHNTVMCVAVAAAEQGMCRIDRSAVKDGNINVAQMDGAVATVATVNGNVAANTPVEQSLSKLTAIEQQQTQSINNPSQTIEQPKQGRSMG